VHSPPLIPDRQDPLFEIDMISLQLHLLTKPHLCVQGHHNRRMPVFWDRLEEPGFFIVTQETSSRKFLFLDFPGYQNATSLIDPILTAVLLPRFRRL
jgi:hypothetical protein